MKVKKQSIVGLHYLRAIATILVVAFHAIAISSLPAYFGPGPLTEFFKAPAGEIDFFFLMSGFIMVASSTDAVTGSPRLSALEFLRRRAFRLIPMLWLTVILYNVVLFVGYHHVAFWVSLRTLFFWPVGNTLPYVAWTIRYEVVFYLVFALCFLWRPKLAPLLFLWSAFSLVRYLVTGVTADDGSFVSFLCSPHNLEFGIGAGLALIMRRVSVTFETNLLLPGLIAIALLLRIFVNHFGLTAGTIPMVLAIAPICIATLVAARCIAPNRASPVMMALGDASYSIFLLHAIVVFPVVIVLHKIAPELYSTLVAILATVAAVAFGYAGHHFVERHLTDMTLNKAFQWMRTRRLTES